jgi:hypothetical protein
MATEIDIAVTTTTYDVTIVAEPNEYIVNITTGGGGGGNQTLAQTLVLGNTTGGENILINDADAIELENTSLLKKGTYDFGGDGGISRICSNQYEDMWQSGFRHVFDQSGFIRHSTNCFDVIPDSSFDVTLRFKVNSLWTLDNGTTYKCSDASTGAAVWEIYNNFIPNLTQVLTVGDKEFQQIEADRDFEIADRLKYSVISGGMTMTLDDDLDLFPINSLIQFFVSDSSDINATATLNFGAGTACYYLIENITTLTLNVGDFCELKKASAGSVWLLNVWNKSSGGGGVPYTGATQDVDLGEFGLLTGNIEFDNTPTNIPTTAGSMVYNDNDGTVDLILKGGNVTLQIGQEQVIRVVNKTATNVNLLEANYQAVRVTGAQGQRLKVDLAQATTDTLSAGTIGLVTETINNNQEGFITTSGLIRNIDTTGSLQSETWADGDILYLSPTVAGRVTKVKPVAPNHLVIVGYVVHAHATQGTIFVKVDNGYELNELHNVKITTAANGQALTYTSATNIWENKTIIQDSITDGVTTVAPSQNSVFDALQFTRKLITNGTGSVTGTTSETILTSLTIPANTLDSKCFIWSTMDYFKTNSGSCTLRLYVNSANSLSGATLIGFLTLGSNRNASFNRKLYLNGTTLDFLVSSTSNSQINNEFIEALFGASTTLTVDPTANIFLIYTTQNDVVGTVATSKQATVQKMKLN